MPCFYVGHIVGGWVCKKGGKEEIQMDVIVRKRVDITKGEEIGGREIGMEWIGSGEVMWKTPGPPLAFHK